MASYDVVIEIPGGAATNTRSTTRPAASSSTGCCSRASSTRPITATSRTPSAWMATRWTCSSSSSSRSSPASASRCRPVGVFKMERRGRQRRQDHRSAGQGPALAHIQQIEDVPEQTRKEIAHFFEHYKDLEPGKWVKTEGWAIRRGRGALRGDPEAPGRGSRTLSQDEAEAA